MTRVRVQLRGGSSGDGDGYTSHLVRQGARYAEHPTESGGDGGDGGFVYFEIAVSPGTSYSLTAGGNGADGARSRDGADGAETALRRRFRTPPAR